MRVDLNADLGEGFGQWRSGDDEALLDVITSANIACGFHAGDPLIMRRVCEQAGERGVAIGAQVGYHDLAGFGRRHIEMPVDALSADVLYQLGALQAFAIAAGTRVRYVKAHGALYNAAADDSEVADAIAAAIASFDSDLALLGLAGSEFASAAQRHQLRFVAEAFADRGYTAAGRLVPREQPGALITDTDAVVAQAVGLVTDGRVRAVNGAEVSVSAASICVHGDTPGATQLARAVRAALVAAGVTVTPFT